MIPHRLPALKAMKALYDLQMLHKVTWREGTPHADTFSASLAALLDGMLDPNPVTRLSLEQVYASEWMHEPVPHKLQVRTAFGTVCASGQCVCWYHYATHCTQHRMLYQIKRVVYCVK